MGLKYLLKCTGVVLLLLAMPVFLRPDAIAQIKVFERTQERPINDIGLFRESTTRKKISLNGQWEVSFNEGKTFQKMSVPLAYSFRGKALYKRTISIPADSVDMYSYIFVAEGIGYEADIKVNGNFVATHTGGYTPIIASVNDGIITPQNEVFITVNSELNYSNTLPLSDQINYGITNGGINKDIYLLAVPKLHVSKSVVRYSVDNLLSVKLTNHVLISSSNLSKLTSSGKDSAFSVKTIVIRKSSQSEVASSQSQNFAIGENNSIKIECDASIQSPILWTSELPETYTVKTVIYSGSQVVDEFEQETGFTSFSFKSGQVYVNGKPQRIIGANYFEDQLKNSTALSYEVVEKDLAHLKSLGFNAIRIPGRCAHPYVVELCNRTGLFLMQEIPLNEEDYDYLEDEKRIRLILGTLLEIIERDVNSPCILAWGIGNDFDVAHEASSRYVSAAVSIIDSADKRLKYYTSRAWNEDICSEMVDFVGINFYERKYEDIKNAITDITNRQKPAANRKNTNIFVARFGLRIENQNTNGFSDIHSQEAQMKFFGECYPKVMQSTMGGFVSSFADWHASNPLNYRLSDDPSLVTDGLFTYGREEKRSAAYIKRIINSEDLPRIQEGNFLPDFPYVFIILGIAMMIILLFFLNRDKKLRSGLVRCVYKPTYFFSLVRDQMIVSTGYNLLIAFSVSIGIALLFSSIFFFLRAGNSLDMILAKLFTEDSLKLIVSEIINNKFYMLSFFTICSMLVMVITAFVLYFVSFYTRGKSFFKNIFTISVWSTVPMLIFLPLGTVLYKLAEGNNKFLGLSVWLFFILYLLYLNRVIIGARTLFDIRTGRVYTYGIAIIGLFFALLYLYLLIFTGVLETTDLVRHLTAR